ncbi:hypothetical protein SLS60_000932 [Paraconiothyrium brasiliense]|uniref:Rrn9 domain-containing protein n=1 Tax=Paraconiothyrium brasiliense TaxID=300254 RepID=A0ABR3S8F2_9PLEO
MSLFGGDESSPSAPSPSLSERSSSPQNVQDPQPLPDPNDSLDEDFLPSSPDAESERCTIKPQSWRRYTQADREIAESLENLESADLAAHLYNAHSLKRRLRRPTKELQKVKDWQSKDAWLKKGKELQYNDPLTGDLETELVPSKLWTAWPLPTKRILQKGAATGKTEDNDDGWYIGRSEDKSSGEVMREELLALFLRTAKRNWTRRQAAAEDTVSHVENVTISSSPSSSDSEAGVAHAFRNSKPQDSGSDTRKKNAKGSGAMVHPYQSDGEQVMRHLDEWDVGNKEDVCAKRTLDDSSVDTESDSASQSETRHRDCNVPEAAFLADDDEARRILEPSVNSLLSRVDKLVLAVRRHRANHVGDGLRRAGSGSDCFTDRETPAPHAKPPSRPQSRSRVSKKTGSSQRPPAKRQGGKTHRPSHEALNALDSETASDYGADSESEDEETLYVLEKQKKARTHSISSSNSHRSNASSNPEVHRSVGLIDWSEMLGLAAIAGFDEHVVAKTAQRCASLFGEGMNFRTFDENLATQPILNPVEYTPCMIPAFHEMQSVPDVVHESVISEGDRRPLVKRPYFDSGSLRCPHIDCPGSLKEFSGSSRLTEHVRRKHGYDPRTNDSDTEERTFGGVHIDGYLQPVWAKPGWLGHGRAKSEAADNETQAPRRKRQRLRSKPTSTVTSAYTTQDETEDEEQMLAGRTPDMLLNPTPRTM